jgi:hypothetical protein
MLQVHLPLRHDVLMHLLAVPAARVTQAATVRASRPKAATIAWMGQPWHSKVRTMVTTSAAVCTRETGGPVVAAKV